MQMFVSVVHQRCFRVMPRVRSNPSYILTPARPPRINFERTYSSGTRAPPDRWSLSDRPTDQLPFGFHLCAYNLRLPSQKKSLQIQLNGGTLGLAFVCKRTRKRERIGEGEMCVRTAVWSIVTRFGEIWPLWQNFESFGQNLGVYLVLGKIWILLWQRYYAIGQVCTVVGGQIF